MSNLVLTIADQLKVDIEQVDAMIFPSISAQNEVQAQRAEYLRVGKEMIQYPGRETEERFRSHRSAFWDAIRRLQIPPSPPDEKARVGSLIARDWQSSANAHGLPEFDEVWKVIRPDERVLRWDGASVTLGSPQGERVLTRRQLRLMGKPVYSTKSDEEFLDFWGPCERPKF